MLMILQVNVKLIMITYESNDANYSEQSPDELVCSENESSHETLSLPMSVTLAKIDIFGAAKLSTFEEHRREISC